MAGLAKMSEIDRLQQHNAVFLIIVLLPCENLEQHDTQATVAKVFFFSWKWLINIL